VKNCKVIEDLLPNYAEKLTSEETNQYIENHMAECKDCSEKLKIIQKEIEVDKRVDLKKESNYLKKYNKKLRIFEAIILIAIAVFIVTVGRKMLIIQCMQNKIAQYDEIDNFYRKCNYYQGDIMGTTEIYKKEDKFKSRLSDLWFCDENTRLDVREVYGNDKNENWYIIDNYNNKDKSRKTAMLNQKGSKKTMKGILGMHNFETNNFWELFIMAITSNISSESCNGKECYRISYTVFTGCPATPILWQQEHYRQIYYLERETGLPVRSIDNRDIRINHGEKEEILDYEYEFGNVTEEDMKEPDIGEYEIVK